MRDRATTILNGGILIGLVLVALDSLVVAHFEVEAALALVRYTPPLTLLVGVVLNLGPILAEYVLGGLLVALACWGAAGRLDRVVVAGFCAAVVFFLSNALFDKAATWSPARMVACAGGAVVAAVLLSKLIDRDLIDVNAPSAVLILGILIASTALISDPALRQSVAMPYVPPERVELEGVVEPLIGYVLDVDQSGQWTTIMTESSREVVVVPSTTVMSRTVCTLEPHTDTTPRWPVVPASASSAESC